MKIKYIPNVENKYWGVLDSSSTLSEEYIYVYSSDPDWAERMIKRGEKVLCGNIEKTYHVDNQSFDSLEKAQQAIIRKLKNMENSSMYIEVTTVFFVKENGDTDFTHMEQLRR